MDFEDESSDSVSDTASTASPAEPDLNGWTEEALEILITTNEQQPVPQHYLQPGASPINFFFLMFPLGLIMTFVQETNRYEPQQIYECRAESVLKDNQSPVLFSPYFADTCKAEKTNNDAFIVGLVIMGIFVVLLCGVVVIQFYYLKRMKKTSTPGRQSSRRIKGISNPMNSTPSRQFSQSDSGYLYPMNSTPGLQSSQRTSGFLDPVNSDPDSQETQSNSWAHEFDDDEEPSDVENGGQIQNETPA